MITKIALFSLLMTALSLPAWSFDKMKLSENISEPKKVEVEKVMSAERAPSAVEEEVVVEKKVIEPKRIYHSKVSEQ